MQQPSVADYFKTKKRIRDEAPTSKASKLLAVSAPSELAAGLDKPNPIRASSSPNPESIAVDEPTFVEPSPSRHNERKTAKGKRRVPCYQRYHHLISTQNDEDVEMAPTRSNESPISAQAINSSRGRGDSYAAPNLPLPYKYKVLAELFRALETVSSIFLSRNELITLNKVRPGVLELVRTTQLREKHLAQFLTIFPGCYTFTQEKIKAPGSREAVYQLVITPNLGASSFSFSIPPADKMSAALITERRAFFHNALLDLCFKAHKEFLLTLNPPIVVPADKQVTRWHPKFPLNDIPNIELSELPKTPEKHSISASTAKEVISRAQSIMDAANPRMRNALQELMKKTAGGNLGSVPTAAASPQAPTAPVDPAEKRAATKAAILKAQEALKNRASGNPAMREALNKILLKNNKLPIPVPAVTATSASVQPPATPGGVEKGNPFNNKNTLAALKGVSQSLIDKIRAREKEKSIRSMTLTPEETKNRAMLNRLPEFVKTLRNTMVVEKKSILALRLVVERLGHSHYRSLSDTEVEGHIRFLHKTVPDWLTILKTTQGDFVKIDKDVNINNIVQKIEETINKTK